MQITELQNSTPPYRLRQLGTYALRLGTVGFGGPVALVGYMHRDLVEDRKWISESDFKEGLALAQLMPGPLAAQLAIYLGYVHYGVIGATLVGVAFVIPSFLIVLALGWAYVTYGGLPWMQAVFYGVGAAVIGVITISTWKLTRKSLQGDYLLWLIFLVSLAATVATENENVLLFLGAGVLVWFLRAFRARSPRATNAAALLVPPVMPLFVGATEVGRSELLTQIGLFFAKAGAFVFGSGLAIIPFLYSGVVKQQGWLNDQEFLDSVAVAMITPGPVVITVGFIGYLVTGRSGGFFDGLAGASVAAIATFLPCYFFTVIPAPYFKKHGKKPGIIAFVDGVTAAAVGAISGACIVLGRRTIFPTGWSPDVPKVVLLLVTLALLLRFKRIQEPFVILGAAVIGLVIYPLLNR